MVNGVVEFGICTRRLDRKRKIKTLKAAKVKSTWKQKLQLKFNN